MTQKELEAIKAESSLNYLGYIDLQKELHNYDVLLSLSDYEGFSRVLLEAIYVGLYVVAYNNNGTKYIMEDIEKLSDTVDNLDDGLQLQPNSN